MKRCRLIYKSLALPETLEAKTISNLVEKAAIHNKKTGITGLLLLSGDRFLQVLEGPVRFTNQLFVNIVKDTRHTDVELVCYEEITSACFHDWSMQLVNLSCIEKTKLALMHKKYQTKDDFIIFPSDKTLILSLLIDAKNLSLEY